MHYDITKKQEFEKADTRDLIKLLPAAAGANEIYIEKLSLIALAHGLAKQEIVHISGPTGTGKTSLINALIENPENWRLLVSHLGIPYMPLRVVTHSAVGFESPSDLFYRRAIKPDGGGTYDEPSALLSDLKKLSRKSQKKYYSVVWISELLRMPGAVQSAFVELINKRITDSKGKYIGDGNKIAWLFDSNYQAAADNNLHFELSPFDEALKARNTIMLNMDYLNIEQEIGILREYSTINKKSEIIPNEMLYELVEMASYIRQAKNRGELAALPMPTFRQYFAFLRMAASTNLETEDLFEVVFFGLGNNADKTALKSVQQEIKYKYETDSPGRYKFDFS